MHHLMGFRWWSLSKNDEVGYFRQMLFGYARVSSADQNPAHQIDALTRAGIDAANIHTDHAGGAKASRPQLDAVLTRLRSGDTLVITRLDRLGRSVVHLITLGAELRERGIGLKVLEQGIDTATAEGRAMFGMLSVLAELQRELIVANTRDGLAAARARGRKGGRPPKLTDDQIVLAQQLYDAGEKTVAQIAAMLNVPRTTVYGHLNKRTPAASASTDSVSTVAAVPVVPARTSRICPSCGYEPSTRAEAAHQRGDLAVIWLHPHTDNPADPAAVIARSHCHQCEPGPPAFDVACTVCGDGPILAGDFAQTARSGALPDPVQQWLTASGWAVLPELRCPDHT
ncbi:recombinase family protein [Kitasatospora sp. NPDC018623]|uniref:recombinase family protein n=2 Tax=Actinomycetota TaxID=201174 RepID=UPI003794D834